MATTITNPNRVVRIAQLLQFRVKADERYLSIEDGVEQVLSALPLAVAPSGGSTGNDGLMSRGDKAKVDGIPANPKYTDTTYENASQSAAGLMSSGDKTKLDGIEEGAQKNVTPTWDAITGKPSTFTPSAHTHTKSDISDFTHTHTKSQISDFPTLGTAAAKGVASGVNTSENLVQSNHVKAYVDDRSLIPVNINALTPSSTFVKGNVLGINGRYYRCTQDTSNFPVTLAVDDGAFVVNTVNGNISFVITDNTLNSGWELWSDAGLEYNLALIEQRLTQIAIDGTTYNIEDLFRAVIQLMPLLNKKIVADNN